MLNKRVGRYTVVVVASTSIAGSLAVPAANAEPLGDARADAVRKVDEIELAARRAFGSSYGCVLDRNREIALLITSRSQLPTAQAIVRSAGATRQTTIRTIMPSRSESRMREALSGIIRMVGRFNPDVNVRGEQPTGWVPSACSRIQVLLSNEAPRETRARVARVVRRYGSRVTVLEVAPDELTPPSGRGGGPRL